MISGGYTISKKKKTDLRQLLIPIAIILILGSVFIALFLLAPIQDLLYRPYGFWLFEPPKAAYISFVAALLAIAIFLIIFSLLSSSEKKRKMAKLLVGIAILLSFGSIFLSFNQYHYVDNSGIHINKYFSLHEKHYKWNDLKSVTQKVKVKNGIMSDDKLEVVFKDGSSYSFVTNKNVQNARVANYQELEDHKVKLIREVPND